MSFKLILQFLILTAVISGVLIFFLKKILFDSTQGAVNRLNRETDEVRNKQNELNEKIKQANEELIKRRAEADDLVAKMKTTAEEKAKEEREKVLNKARAEVEEILTKAQNTKEDMRKAIEKEMEVKTVDFSILILNEILGEKSLPALHAALVTDFLQELESIDMEMISKDIDSADVLSALPLEDAMKKKLEEILFNKLNRVIKLNIEVKKEVISGIALRFANLALDGSLAHMILEKGEEIREKKEKGLI